VLASALLINITEEIFAVVACMTKNCQARLSTGVYKIGEK
jgi:hypothetical protein